ncbi:MAG: hypothetical protein LUM44_17820 [Pyrinomonadaceae bacterium]|nr:hypothetical protein [Pyrinomonadaceae bacterium]
MFLTKTANLKALISKPKIVVIATRNLLTALAQRVVAIITNVPIVEKSFWLSVLIEVNMANENRTICDRCGKKIDKPFHYVPRNGKYFFCSDRCLLADYKETSDGNESPNTRRPN